MTYIEISEVAKEIKGFAEKYETRLHQHANAEVNRLIDNHNLVRKELNPSNWFSVLCKKQSTMREGICSVLRLQIHESFRTSLGEL